MKTLAIIVLCLTCVAARADMIQTSGDVLQIALPAGAVGATLWHNDTEGLGEFALGLGSGMGITHSLKLCDMSSGHTTSAFASAEFIRKKYGLWYGVPAYALAGWTGYSRIHAEKHEWYEVGIGAVVGMSSAWFFTGNKIQVAPYKQVGAQIRMMF